MLDKRANWREQLSPIPGTKAYRWGDVNVIVGKEPKVGWHLSISVRYRNPTWEEIRDARYRFVPEDVTMAMFLPPIGEYVNIHDFCFHLYESKDGIIS